MRETEKERTTPQSGQTGVVELPVHLMLEKEFERLARQWEEEETFFLSSLTKIYAHPAYQKIMDLGIDGLPWVLRELQKNKGHWFHALKFMAGENGRGVAAGMDNFEDAKAAWLEWGHKNNYI